VLVAPQRTSETQRLGRGPAVSPHRRFHPVSIYKKLVLLSHHEVAASTATDIVHNGRFGSIHFPSSAFVPSGLTLVATAGFSFNPHHPHHHHPFPSPSSTPATPTSPGGCWKSALTIIPTVSGAAAATLNFTDLGSPFGSGGGAGGGGGNAGGGGSANAGSGGGGGSNTPTPTGSMAAADALDSAAHHHNHHHHLTSGGGLPPTSHQDTTTSSNTTTATNTGGSVTGVNKSAFIELQQHAGVAYNPISRAAAAAAAYSQHHHPAAHHFNQGGPQPAGGPPGHHHAAVDPRTALGPYPFPPMHQNSYTGYHLGSYPPQCPSPPKDGKQQAPLLGPL
jgi:hypothetical protein